MDATSLGRRPEPADRDGVTAWDSVTANVAAWSEMNAQYTDLLRGAGFDVERLIELQAPGGATAHEYYDEITPEWASKWPHEEIWVARLRG